MLARTRSEDAQIIQHILEMLTECDICNPCRVISGNFIEKRLNCTSTPTIGLDKLHKSFYKLPITESGR